MRKIIAGFAMSIDGFIEGLNGEIDWIINDPEHFKEYSKEWKDMDTMLYGRRTYEAVIKYSSAEKNNPFAHMKHYVFSKTLAEAKPPFILVNGDLAAEIEKIRKQGKKNISVFGGAEFLGSLLNIGAVDELAFGICPVILGKGKPAYKNVEQRTDFELKEVKSYRSGVVALRYLRRKK